MYHHNFLFQVPSSNPSPATHHHIPISTTRLEHKLIPSPVFSLPQRNTSTRVHRPGVVPGYELFINCSGGSGWGPYPPRCALVSFQVLQCGNDHHGSRARCGAVRARRVFLFSIIFVFFVIVHSGAVSRREKQNTCELNLLIN